MTVVKQVFRAYQEMVWSYPLPLLFRPLSLQTNSGLALAERRTIYLKQAKRPKGVEPSITAWEAIVLPLH